MTPMPSDIAIVFERFSPDARKALLEIRQLIFDTAEADASIGPLDETLKWGQPAYRPKNGAGTTVRLGQPKSGGCAIYVPCQTTVISDFQTIFPDGFLYDKNRAVLFDTDMPLNPKAIHPLIHAALTYHQKN